MAFNNTPLFIAAAASATQPGVIQLAGDLKGAPEAPQVSGINGVPISATAPAAGQVLTASGPTAAAWATPAPATATAKRVIAGTSSNSITPNGTTTDIFRVTLTSNATLNAPSGTPTDGQQIQVHLSQDGTGSRIITFGSGYGFGTDIPAPTLSTAAGATDILGFQFSAIKGKWLCLGVAKGF